MSKVFAINAGSSSLKFSIYQLPEEKVISSGLIDRIGVGQSNIVIKTEDDKYTNVKDIDNHEQATEELLNQLKSMKVIESFDEISGSGHRIVAGGEFFKDSALLDEEGVQKVEALAEFAPLHNPAEAKVIRAFQKVLPGKPTVGVFDTSFHANMPEKAYLYGVPYEYYEKYQARRYGAHGTSHKYVAQQAAAKMGKKVEDVKIVTAHIGNGASLTAVKYGQSIDTSMGFTPLAGVVMGTRSGDVDPSLLQYVMGKEGIDYDEMMRVLNNESGLKGLSGISSDMRDVEAAAEEGNHRAQIALEIYAHAVKRYIGSYIAELNGIDALVFTAGVGEHDPSFRQAAIDEMDNLGLKLDPERNNTVSDGLISTDDSPVKIFVIPTDEEKMIVEDTIRLGNITE
ncbi:MAG: acetate kinase [Aerococcus sp.]|nr:acetate kinase [Aerococcus sp.]